MKHFGLDIFDVVRQQIDDCGKVDRLDLCSS